MFQELESSAGSSYNHPRENKKIRLSRVSRKAVAFKLSQRSIKKMQKIRLEQTKRNGDAGQEARATEAPVTINDNANLYFNVRVLSKVGMAITKMKRLVVVSEPDFKKKELFYIENSEAQQNEPSTLIKYDNRWMSILEIIFLLASLSTIWYGTFELVFPRQIAHPPFVGAILISILFLEIFLNFNTQKIDKNGELINRREPVKIYYFSHEFAYDVVGTLATLILVIAEIVDRNSVDTPFCIVLKLLCVLKYKSTERIMFKLQFLYATSTESQTNFSILKLIGKLFCFIHILSLLFNIMQKHEKNTGITVTWVEKSEISYSSDFDLYIYGWYWGSTMLTTVGFGDITPGNKYEAFLVSFLEVLCCAVFGYCINYIGSLVSVLGESTNVYQKTLRRVSRHLENYSVDSRTKSDIKMQLFYKHKLQEIYDPEAEEIIKKSLPKMIREQLFVRNNTGILTKVKYFCRLPTDILHSLAIHLKKATYSPEQFIFHKKQNDIRMWILDEGTVCDYFNSQPHNNEKIMTLYDSKVNQMLGYINFMTGQPYHASAKSKTFTVAYELHRNDFVNVLKNNRKEYLKLCELKDRLILNGQKYESSIVSTCQACNKVTHNVIMCPKIHYLSPSIHILLLRRNKKKLNCMRQYIRREWEKFNSRDIYLSLNDQEISYSNQEVRNGGTTRTSQISKKKKTSFFMEVIWQNQQKHRVSANNAYIPPTKLAIPTNQDVVGQQEPSERAILRWVSQDQPLGSMQFDRCKFQEPEQYFPNGYVHNVVQKLNLSNFRK